MKNKLSKNEQKEKLMIHLKHGYDLKSSTSQSADTEKFAWLRKTSSLLHIFNPKLSTMDFGIIGRSFGDIRGAIDKLNKIDIESNTYHYKLNEEFAGAIANLEGILECIDISPESIAVDKSQKKVNPYFFEIPSEVDNHLIFVLMPFTEPWSDRIWKSHIKPVIEGIKFDPPLIVKRADDLFGHDVMHDIVAAISSAKLIIADITGRNPNVFYELGIAHWIGKRVILLTQSSNDIPFDLLRFRHIIYEDNSDGYNKLKVGLEGAILESFA